MRHVLHATAPGVRVGGPRLLLAILLGLFLLLTPVAAQAASGAGSPPGGMFDCLGELDWGCKVIDFLFLSTDNQITYDKDGLLVTEQPSPIERAFRTMLAFFSNAVLVIASLKLLFELIQMVAETAHSGHVGGKDTNQLWAPIRLVVAIGLLVPLSSGLNSGQYIVIQIAKWGSGLASQGWIEFTKALNEDQRISGPVPPQVQDLGINTVRTYACVAMVNYYARNGARQVSQLIGPPQEQNIGRNNTDRRLVFGNNVHNDVCGEIVFRYPTSADNNKYDQQVAKLLAELNFAVYDRHHDDLMRVATTSADYFLPENMGRAIGDTSQIEAAVQRFQDDIYTTLESQRDVGSRAMQAITADVAKSATIGGWTSAGSWFLALTRAQGNIINGGLTIPRASGPNLDALVQYRDAFGVYQQFNEWLASSTRHQDINRPSPSNSAPEVRIDNDMQAWWARQVSKGGRFVIDGVLDLADSLAQHVGLWTSDPRRAFGDIGGGNNPFGEIMAFGHKKLRLGLDYLGVAIGLQVGGELLKGLGDMLSNVPGPVSHILKFTGAAAAMVGMVFVFLSFLFLAAGLLLGFVVPLLPFVRFFFAIITWLTTLIEAIICAPLMALAHLTPKGEGFAGPHVRGAYFLIFQIFLRPILSLFGMIAALLVFYVGAKFLNAAYYEAAGSIGVFEGGMAFVFKAVISIFYVGLVFVLANSSFKLIEHVVRHALRWMGAQASEGSFEEEGGQLNTLIYASTGKAFVDNFMALPKNIGDGAGSLARPLGNLIKPLLPNGSSDSPDAAKDPDKDRNAHAPRDMPEHPPEEAETPAQRHRREQDELNERARNARDVTPKRRTLSPPPKKKGPPKPPPRT